MCNNSYNLTAAAAKLKMSSRLIHRHKKTTGNRRELQTDETFFIFTVLHVRHARHLRGAFLLSLKRACRAEASPELKTNTLPIKPRSQPQKSSSPPAAWFAWLFTTLTPEWHDTSWGDDECSDFADCNDKLGWGEGGTVLRQTNERKILK